MVKGTNDTVSAMPIINKSPIFLNDFEIVAVVALLQTLNTPGDYSKVTVLQDWEHYFGKKLIISLSIFASGEASFQEKMNRYPVTLPDDSTKEILKKMSCIECHNIPGLDLPHTQMGSDGPLLIMKTNAVKWIKSAKYKSGVKIHTELGIERAATPKGYVIESILHHELFTVPGYRSVNLRGYRYGDLFTADALNRLADFLRTQGEAEAKKEGFNLS